MYLHIVITSICVMDYKLLSNFQIPRRLNMDLDEALK